jgi:Rrf2 family iron-sulfur cluster assembly transcriptional regulator
MMAMLDLAIHDRFGPVTLMDIAENQHISLSYLEQLFARLRKQGLVDGTRGPGGGYRLARTPEDISVADIVIATDGVSNSAAFSAPAVYHNTECTITHELWKDLSRRLYEFLNGISLADLVNQPEVLTVIQTGHGLHAKALPPHLRGGGIEAPKSGWGVA